MKIYVDELPECCNDCEFGYFYDCQYCSLRPDLAREDIWVEKEKHCPLLSIEFLKQQVREEVVEEIKKFANSIFTRYEKRELDDVAYGELLCCNVLIKKLGGVKRENNVQD